MGKRARECERERERERARERESFGLPAFYVCTLSSQTWYCSRGKRYNHISNDRASKCGHDQTPQRNMAG